MAEHLLLPDRVVLSSRRAGGGGGGTPPRNPSRHGAKLQAEIRAVIDESPRVEGVDPDLVFKVRAVGRLDDPTLAARQLQMLGETEDYTYFVLSSDDARALREQLHMYASGADEDGAKAPLSSIFGTIESIEPYGREDRIGLGIAELLTVGATSVVDISLWPSPTFEETQRRLRNVETLLSRHNSEVIARDDRPQFTVLRARVAAAALDELLDLGVVETIRTPPVPFLDPADWRTLTADDLTVSVLDAPPVGVLDDAIEGSHPLLAAALAAQHEFAARGYPWQQRGHHGSMVAGLAVFGDIESSLKVGTAFSGGGPVVGARVLEPDPRLPTRTRFPMAPLPHQLVEQAVRKLNADYGIRVFNLSFGYAEPFIGPHVSQLTEIIDLLVRELDIVIVVAAGNTSVTAQGVMDSGHHVKRHYPTYVLDPVSRISEPAPAALALTVGSVARSAGPASISGRSPLPSTVAIAEVDQVSPFSRSGPGLGPTQAKAIKPEVVDYGGNWVLTDSGMVDGANPGVSVVSLAAASSGQLFRAGNGTSFAAPRVSRVAADVLARYPNASANLIRALIALAARIPSPLVSQFPDEDDRRRAVGYGRPAFDLATSSGGSRVVMYFDGELDVDTSVIHPVPIPEAFAVGQWERRVTISLAFDPPVRRQRREYMASTCKVDLVRNTSVEELRTLYAKQDIDEKEELFTDRRRAELLPGTNRMLSSTLQVRSWTRKRLDVDDGDMYFVVVTNKAQTWAAGLKGYSRQRYAVAVELDAVARPDLDLYGLVQQQVQPRARARLRGA